jgi:hypothetical protein
MAAGLGFKTFTTGEVLTAADTNGYLMQGVLVFADAAARDAAITSPQEGQFAYTKDVNGLWYYDSAAWVASGATGDIEGVTAGTGISGGGTSGTVTITNSMATAIDAKGDLIGGTGADAFDRLAVGTDGQTLTADSAEATGLKWATPASGGGKVLQVVSATYSTQVNIATSTFTDTGLTATITPTSATSKILIMITTVCRLPNSRAGSGVLDVGSDAKILRGATNIYETTGSGFMYQYLDSIVEMGTKRMSAIHYYDSPATTSSTTYKLQANMTTATGNIFFQTGGSGGTGSIILLEIGV